MKIDKNEKINELLTRGVGEFIDPDGTFLKKLKESPEKIIIKFGVDPTRPDIHLGHAVILRKLRKFQDLGCKVIFLIGDYTAMIGDPTGKNKLRPLINKKEIEENMSTYLKQVGLILNVTDKSKYEWLTNSIWYQSATDYEAENMVAKANLWEKDRERIKSIRGQFPTITLWNFMYTLRGITHSRIIGRDMFKKRIETGEELYLNEMMYPILQGIDSNIIGEFFGSCDLEVGGTDQHFNMLVGRDVMEMNKQIPQSVLSFKIIEGLDGREKMSKSLDNYIGITDEPNDMYGKVMSIPDSSIVNYFELCTFTPMEEVEEISRKLKNDSVNPKEIKMNLARQIVEIYHGKEKAILAEENFENTFAKKGVPENVEEIKGEGLLMPIILEAKLADSNSEIRRLFEAGAITDMTENKKMTSTEQVIKNHVYKIGKHKFIKII